MTDTIADAIAEAYDALDIPEPDFSAEELESEEQAPEVPVEQDGQTEEGEPEEAEEPEESEGEEDEGDGAAKTAKGGGSGEVIEVPEGATLRLPDGTEVPADKAVLFQAAFTRKTQALAEERKALETQFEEFQGVQQQVRDTYEQMNAWYTERVQRPADWVQEIAIESGDATRVIGRALYALAQAGQLDERLTKALGLTEGDGVPAQIAQEDELREQLTELQAWKESQEQTRQQQSAVHQRVAQYHEQWDEITTLYGAEFDSPQAENAAKRELVEFAQARGLTHNLVDAWQLMQAVKQPPKQAEAPKPKPQVTPAQQQALRAVTPRSVGGGSGKKVRTAPVSTRSAVLEALEEMGAAG